jgi:type I restriction enzyme, S subunit
MSHKLNNIPSGWKAMALSECAQYHNGIAFKPEHCGREGTKIIRIEQLNNPTGVYDFYAGSFPDTNSINNGDLIFSWSATLKACIWRHGRAVLNQHLFKVVPYAKIDKRFFFNILDLYIDELGKGSHGSTMKHIKRSELRKFFVPIPISISEQQKIASILSSIDSEIENTHSLIAKFNAIKQGMMQDLLYRGIDENGELRKPYEEAPWLYEKTLIGHIPKDWRLSPLDKYCRVQGGYAFSSLDFVETGIQLIRIGALYENRFDLKRDPVFLPYNFAEKFKEFLVESGDVLISLTGTVGKQDYGFAVMVPETKRKMLLNQRAGRFVTFDGISKRFLIQLLHSDLYLKQLYSQPGGTKQANLTGKQVVSALLPIPPILEQEQIADSILSVEKTIEKEKLFADKLHDIKSGLMQDLLTGKVRVKVDESTGNTQDVGVPQS